MGLWTMIYVYNHIFSCQQIILHQQLCNLIVIGSFLSSVGLGTGISQGGKIGFNLRIKSDVLQPAGMIPHFSCKFVFSAVVCS